MVDLGRAQEHLGKAHVRIGTPVTLVSCVEVAERRAGSSAMEKVIPHGIDVSQRINAIIRLCPGCAITFALPDTDGRVVTAPRPLESCGRCWSTNGAGSP